MKQLNYSIEQTPRAGLKGFALELRRTKKPVLHAPFLLNIHTGAAHLDAVSLPKDI